MISYFPGTAPFLTLYTLFKEAGYTGTEDEFKQLIADGLVGEIHGDPFIGATNDVDGEEGIVPQPLMGDSHSFLNGSGGWTKVTKSDYRLTEETGILYLNVELYVDEMYIPIKLEDVWRLFDVDTSTGQLVMVGNIQAPPVIVNEEDGCLYWVDGPDPE